jgi:hypothetical protein
VLCHDANNEWRKDVEPQTFQVILENTDRWSSATLGYIPSTLDDKAGRHALNIFRDSTLPDNEQIASVAHEMGHVLGMVHEHQREDRDDHVNFDCTKVAGYDDVKKTYDKNPSKYAESMEEICASNWLADKYFGWPLASSRGVFHQHGCHRRHA